MLRKNVRGGELPSIIRIHLLYIYLSSLLWDFESTQLKLISRISLVMRAIQDCDQQFENPKLKGKTARSMRRAHFPRMYKVSILNELL